MSSKHGPAQVPNENYPTMAWPVDRLLEAVDLPGGRWLEPCARFGRTFLLNLTPDDVRKAQRPTDWKERRAAAKQAKEDRARAKAQKILGAAS